jgi:pSer/pThr/pTyr-binding forkhead associated (FHA) protein
MRRNGSAAKRLYSFAIGRKHHELTLVKSQILNLERVFVRPPNWLPFCRFPR